jgi:predicted transcriptional regulator
MDTVPRPDEDTPGRPHETEAERQRRLAWEADRIAEADAEIEAGLYVDSAEIKAWIDSIGTDHELPPPPTRHR